MSHWTSGRTCIPPDNFWKALKKFKKSDRVFVSNGQLRDSEGIKIKLPTFKPFESDEQIFCAEPKELLRVQPLISEASTFDFYVADGETSSHSYLTVTDPSGDVIKMSCLKLKKTEETQNV